MIWSDESTLLIFSTSVLTPTVRGSGVNDLLHRHQSDTKWKKKFWKNNVHPFSRVYRLADSMPRNIEAVLAASGSPTQLNVSFSINLCPVCIFELSKWGSSVAVIIFLLQTFKSFNSFCISLFLRFKSFVLAAVPVSLNLSNASEFLWIHIQQSIWIQTTVFYCCGVTCRLVAT